MPLWNNDVKMRDWHLQSNDDTTMIINEKDRFELDLEVPYFKMEEINVKVKNDKLSVHCSEKEDEGHTPREIYRAYRLPQDVDVGSLKSTILPNGYLQITAKKIKR